MTDSILKPLIERHKELDKELDEYFNAIEDMWKTIKSYEAIFNRLSEEKSRISNAIRFLEKNKEGWYDSNS